MAESNAIRGLPPRQRERYHRVGCATADPPISNACSLCCISVPTTTAAARMERKTAQLATAMACGERLAWVYVSESDPLGFLSSIGSETLTRHERAAREGLLPATWQGAFARGWRNARSRAARDGRPMACRPAAVPNSWAMVRVPSPPRDPVVTRAHGVVRLGRLWPRRRRHGDRDPVEACVGLDKSAMALRGEPPVDLIACTTQPRR